LSDQQKKSPPEKKIRKGIDLKDRIRSNAYLKYSGMAFEMAAMIFVGTFTGKKLDAYLHTDRPYFTLLGALLGTIASLYITLKDILFPPK
jgi:F0F1-type ATP synthase assembly protein I